MNPSTKSRLRLIGETYLKYSDTAGRNYRYGMYGCTCGNIIETREYQVSSGRSLSCGCLAKEILSAMAKHGESKYKNRKNSTEYSTWQNMRERCYNKNRKNYDRYGGRGITVCDRWHEFTNFLEDMGRKPSKEYEIERIDNDLGYYKENCKWATRLEQTRNQAKTIFIEYDGLRLCLSEWVEKSGIPKGTIRRRLKLGWPFGRAITEPVMTQFRHKSTTS